MDSAHNGPHAVAESLRGALWRIWRRRRLALGVAYLAGLIAMLAYPWIPQRYESTARIYVDTQSVLKPLMADLTFQPNLDHQVRMLARTMISRPNIERLLGAPGLGLPEGSREERERAIERLMTRIKLTPAEAGLYTVSYRDADPERARRIVQATVDLFVRNSSGDKRRDSEEARRFIEEQIKVYETKLVEAEGRLKEFKLRNFGVTGVSNQDYFVRISALSDELNRLYADLRAAEQSRDAYRRELAAEDPQLPREPAAGAATAVPELEAHLAQQRKQLEELLRRYTDQHPDVVASRQIIARLEAQKAGEEALRARGDAAKPRGPAATSPVYQRLRVALAEAEAQVASLRSRAAVEQRRLDEARALAGRIPQAEAELAQLNRDYDIMRKNYDQLVVRRESASLGEKLDATAQLADFRIVEPARVAEHPVFPGRLPLAAALVAASLLAGLLAPAVVERLHPTIDSRRMLGSLGGRPVVGNVSLSYGAAARRQGRAGMLAWSLALLVFLSAQSAWLGWVVSQAMT